MSFERRILIVGGGVIGAACARRLAGLGRVTVIDAGDVEAKASAGSLAWLNVSSASDPDYARLRAVSLGLWRRLEGAPVEWRGSLLWDDEAADAAVLAAVGETARVVDLAEVKALVPGIEPPGATALHAPDEGVADPRRVTDWFTAEALSAGAIFRQGAVEALTLRGGRVTGAALAGGETVEADEVIVAGGCGTPALLAPLGCDVPLRRAPGGLVITTPAPPAVGPVLATPELDFWQAADGRFLIGTSPGATMEAAARAADHALGALSVVLPAVQVEVEQVILRERPIPGDGFPAVGRIDGVENLFAIVTHSGMTLAPVLAEAAAAALDGAPPRHDLSPYRPGRDFAVRG